MRLRSEFCLHVKKQQHLLSDFEYCFHISVEKEMKGGMEGGREGGKERGSNGVKNGLEGGREGEIMSHDVKLSLQPHYRWRRKFCSFLEVEKLLE